VAKAKKATAVKTEQKPKAAGKPAAGPVIDPSKSAAAAAAMVANKVSAPPTATASAQPQSSTFAKLKESLNKPHAATMGNLLDKLTPPGQKKSALPFGANQQVGHNQTFGGDASRRNVPRRTNG